MTPIEFNRSLTFKSKTYEYDKLNIYAFKHMKSVIRSGSFVIRLTLGYFQQHFAHYGRPASDYNAVVVGSSHNNRLRARAQR